MKKKEAQILVPEKVDVIMEYIANILEDSEKVFSSMNFSIAKINGQNMCTLDIYVPIKNFERHLNLGITGEHSNVIFKELLDRVILDVLPSDDIGVTRFYHLRSNDNFFDGINIINTIGSEIKVNMYGIDRNISDEYNRKYAEYKNSLTGDTDILKRK